MNKNRQGQQQRGMGHPAGDACPLLPQKPSLPAIRPTAFEQIRYIKQGYSF